MEPDPSEVIAQTVLGHLWPDAEVIHHDDNSHHSMYDIRVKGPIQAAAEVSLITQNPIKAAHDHWTKHLRGKTSADLSRYWTFMFTEDPGSPGAPPRYPRQKPPSDGKLVEVLAKLEAKGVTDLQPWQAHVTLTANGEMDWTDADVGELFCQIGPAANSMVTSCPAPQGGQGGWQFVFGRNIVSRPNAEELGRDIDDRLASDELADLRYKLSISGRDHRIAVLHYDPLTSAGWAIRHWKQNIVPAAPLGLPDEVTMVVVIGMNGFVLMFDDQSGWQRRDLPMSCPTG